MTPWIYDRSDPAIMLFTAALKRFEMRFTPDDAILEVGCAESDWLERMHAWSPGFRLTGVDQRDEPHRHGRPGVTIQRANAMEPDLFPPDTFDWVVLLGSLEHMGLGYYGDPVDEQGDTKVMQNVGKWLKPGGFCYFDVPVQPTYRVAENRHFRMYGTPKSWGEFAPGLVSDSLADRLLPPPLVEINRAYSLPEPHAGTWCHEPTRELVPYWFVAVLAVKEA